MPAPYDGRLTTYLGAGDIADRPVAPNTLPGLMAIWFDTTNIALSFWESTIGVWSDYPTPFTEEQVQDIVGLMIQAVPGGNVGVTYDDVAGTVDITGLTDEEIQDKVAAFIVNGTNMTVTYDDVANTLTITGLTDAQIKSKVSYNVPFGFTSTPIASEKLLLHVFTEAITFPDDFAGAQKYVGTNPTASFAMSVKQNGVAIGTITVSTLGVVTFVTTAGAAAFAIGDVMEITAPNPADTTAANMAFTLVGAR